MYMSCNLVIFGIIIIVLAFLVPIISIVLAAGFKIFELFNFFFNVEDLNSSSMSVYGILYIAVFFITGLVLTIYGSNQCEDFNNVKQKKIKIKN